MFTTGFDNSTRLLLTHWVVEVHVPQVPHQYNVTACLVEYMEVMEEIMDAFSFEVPRRGCKVDTWSCRTCLY